MIRFKTADLMRELSALDAIANKFLTRGSSGALKALSESLYRIQKSGRDSAWSIAIDQPVETTVSEGRYQPDGKGGHHVFAEISLMWDVRPLKGGLIEVYDRASTRVTIHADEQIGVISMDLGDPSAPGCYFHSQVSGGSSGYPFPSDFDVPRFPTFVATPASVVEFVLSELFQEDWQRHAQTHQARSTWIASQKRWWLAYLGWQVAQVRGATYSPWVELKRSPPQADMFVV